MSTPDVPAMPTPSELEMLRLPQMMHAKGLLGGEQILDRDKRAG
ncbi:hypothetical protein [Massilia consociata]|uniref:Uncharacterized protein n=1 Tax=Massilia consociata TaxID=760117 RepID=A0ABV6FJA7_9BURK